MARRLSVEKRNEILQDYLKTHASTPVLAARHEISITTVRKIITNYQQTAKVSTVQQEWGTNLLNHQQIKELQDFLSKNSDADWPLLKEKIEDKVGPVHSCTVQKLYRKLKEPKST